MNEQAYFIQDRAQSLAYEAVQFPATADSALSWLYRAMAWAQNQGMTELVQEVEQHTKLIYTGVIGGHSMAKVRRM